jgi:hypothetical protein
MKEKIQVLQAFIKSPEEGDPFFTFDENKEILLMGYNAFHKLYVELYNEGMISEELVVTSLGKKMIHEWISELAESVQDKELSKSKLRWESKLAKIRVKAFPWLFLFSILGAVYGGWDLIDHLVNSESVTKKELKLEVKKLNKKINGLEKEAQSDKIISSKREEQIGD